MKTQLLKLAGASIIAFSLSFFTFMSLTLIAQDINERKNITAVETQQTYENDTTVASVLH
ncbi:hypothetical protein [Anaerotignum sp.]|uniref:hypothetical protein n=1 Tax=Anaerotignum sp. TaxID=2039241 RepID=UPI0033251562